MGSTMCRIEEVDTTVVVVVQVTAVYLSGSLLYNGKGFKQIKSLLIKAIENGQLFV